MVVNLIQEFSQINIKKQEPLSKYTFTHTGGKADWLAFPENVEQVQQLVKFVKKNDMPLTVIGNASNLIVRDGGIAGLVLIVTGMNQIKVEGNNVVAQAGATYIKTTQVARDHSLTGLEFAAGIPGSIGGAVFMNAGAYGGETKFAVKSATIMLPTGEIQELTNEELDFGYRHSSVQDNHGIVLEATFELKPGDKEEITAQMDELNARRAAKQPLELPSCGSVFKRPTGYFAGKLNEDAGLRGYRVGDAQVSEKHCGFVVNRGEATAKDVAQLISDVQNRVMDEFGVKLEPEVRMIGFE